MTKIAHLDGARVIVGVNTHKDEHVAVAIDGLGTRLGEHRLRASPASGEGQGEGEDIILHNAPTQQESRPRPPSGAW